MKFGEPVDRAPCAGRPLRAPHAPPRSRFFRRRHSVSHSGHWPECGRRRLDRGNSFSPVSRSLESGSPRARGGNCSRRAGIRRTFLSGFCRSGKRIDALRRIHREQDHRHDAFRRRSRRTRDGSMVSPNLSKRSAYDPCSDGALCRTREDGLNAHPVTVISYREWQDRFHGDPAIIGKTTSSTTT